VAEVEKLWRTLETSQRGGIFLDTQKGMYPTSSSVDSMVIAGGTNIITISIPAGQVWTGDYLTIGDIPLEVFDLTVVADAYTIFPQTRIGQEHLEWRCPFPLAMHEAITLTITNNDTVDRTFRCVIWYSVIPEKDFYAMTGGR